MPSAITRPCAKPQGECRWFTGRMRGAGEEPTMSEAETLVSSPTRTVRLLDRYPIAEQTLAFELERPPGFDFKAGQFAEITWIDPPEIDDRGNTRAFFITSAPEDRRLTFATRLRDIAFKRILSTAPLGARARVAGPFGNFTLSNQATSPAVLLADGIGITPFRSMARHLAHEKRTRPVLLFYANRRREDAPFLEELWALKNEDPGFSFVPTITGPGYRGLGGVARSAALLWA